MILSKRTFLLIVFFLLSSYNSFTEIAGKYCIDKIEKVIKIAEELKKTEALKRPLLSAWDFDDTIMTGNDFREKTTQNTVHDLQNLGFSTMIITARMRGLTPSHPGLLTTEGIKDSLQRNINTISQTPLRLAEYGAINNDVHEEINVADTNEYAWIDGSIVFAGTMSTSKSNKGQVMVQIIDRPGLLKEKPKTIFVIDDDLKQLRSFEDKFKDREEIVYLFHYATSELCALGYTKF